MKVIHFIDSLRVGGKERQLVELINGLQDKADIDNFIVCMGKEDFYRGDISNAKIQIIYLIRTFRWDPIIFLRLYRLIIRIRPAIIHTNAMLTSFYALPQLGYLESSLSMVLFATLLHMLELNGGWKNGYWTYRISGLLIQSRVSRAGVTSNPPETW